MTAAEAEPCCLTVRQAAATEVCVPISVCASRNKDDVQNNVLNK